jgi:hypothetical protein
MAHNMNPRTSSEGQQLPPFAPARADQDQRNERRYKRCASTDKLRMPAPAKNPRPSLHHIGPRQRKHGPTQAWGGGPRADPQGNKVTVIALRNATTGELRTRVFKRVTSKNTRDVLADYVDVRNARRITDKEPAYKTLGRQFSRGALHDGRLPQLQRQAHAPLQVTLRVPRELAHALGRRGFRSLVRRASGKRLTYAE